MPALTTTSALNRVRTSSATEPKNAKGDTVDAQPKSQGELESPVPEAESPSVLKAVRAYEHERQRVKKAAEVERARERKERKRRAGPCPARTCRTAHGRRANGRRGPFEMDEKPAEGKTTPDKHEERRLLDDDITSQGRGVPELNIVPLIRPAKARKMKDDFEVIPAVRSVIVLDEFIVPEPEVEEPWEYVSVDGEADTVVPPSYAQVVANAM
ncbi:hypothetical protein AcW1_001375 [Taiwanofungus camphoratus]|nr:hypothetical protein AcW1_001375 [Antrodia cinnamomea]